MRAGTTYRLEVEKEGNMSVAVDRLEMEREGTCQIKAVATTKGQGLHTCWKWREGSGGREVEGGKWRRQIAVAATKRGEG
jgi:hypothetical protein